MCVLTSAYTINIDKNYGIIKDYRNNIIMNYYCYNRNSLYNQSGGEGTFPPPPSPTKRKRKKKGKGERDERDRELRVVGEGECVFFVLRHK